MCVGGMGGHGGRSGVGAEKGGIEEGVERGEEVERGVKSFQMSELFLFFNESSSSLPFLHQQAGCLNASTLLCRCVCVHVCVCSPASAPSHMPFEKTVKYPLLLGLSHFRLQEYQFKSEALTYAEIPLTFKCIWL